MVARGAKHLSIIYIKIHDVVKKTRKPQKKAKHLLVGLLHPIDLTSTFLQQKM